MRFEFFISITLEALIDLHFTYFTLLAFFFCVSIAALFSHNAWNSLLMRNACFFYHAVEQKKSEAYKIIGIYSFTHVHTFFYHWWCLNFSIGYRSIYPYLKRLIIIIPKSRRTCSTISLSFFFLTFINIVTPRINFFLIVNKVNWVWLRWAMISLWCCCWWAHQKVLRINMDFFFFEEPYEIMHDFLEPYEIVESFQHKWTHLSTNLSFAHSLSGVNIICLQFPTIQIHTNSACEQFYICDTAFPI